MVENLEFIKSKEVLSQSEVFRDHYESIFDVNQSIFSFNTPLFQDLHEVFNSIVNSYDGLTDYQRDMLGCIFESFNKIRRIIDPHRLTSFEHYLNEDSELLLYRKTDNGLTNIILNPEECIAYSFISTTDNKKVLKFYYNTDEDFEELAYNFFSN